MKRLCLFLMVSVAGLHAMGEEPGGSASDVRSSDMRGMLIHPAPLYPSSSQSAPQVQQLPPHGTSAGLHRSKSVPLKSHTLSVIAEENHPGLPGTVSETVSALVQPKMKPRFLVPDCKLISVDDVKRTIEEVRAGLRDFKQGLREGNGRSHSFVVPDDIVFNSRKAFEQVGCYLGEVKECQNRCVQKKKALPLCCTDQKIFSQVQEQIARAQQGMERLSQNLPGDKKKKMYAVIADIDAELYDLDKLDIYADNLEVRLTCCQEYLAKKTLRQRLFGCWPKKEKGGSSVMRFDDSECPND
jgi:hypothetical protein